MLSLEQDSAVSGYVYLVGAVGELEDRFNSSTITRLLMYKPPSFINTGGTHRGEVFSGIGRLTVAKMFMGISPAFPATIEALENDRIFQKVAVETHGGIASGSPESKSKVTKEDIYLEFKFIKLTFIFSKVGIKFVDETAVVYCAFKTTCLFTDLIQKRHNYLMDGSKKNTDILGVSTTEDKAKKK